jgi:predicted ATPase/class 3 adenylate cyclase
VSAVPQPSGTVTLVFTDIEGSTRLLEQLGVEGYRAALGEHRRVVREACARFAGYEVDYEGDAFFYAFPTAQQAVSAVAQFMVGLEPGPIRVRVGIHTGEPALDPPKYVGMDVHRAARIMSSAHGGQVVVSPSTVGLLEPGSVGLVELGPHRLKDLSQPIPLYQLAVDGLGQDFPPLKTLYRSNLPVPATPFLGREAELAEVVDRLLDPDTRLLTLTGPGGTGKTRLALQAAAEVADSYPDGVFWVPLAPLRDPGLVVPAVAQALEIGERPDEGLVDTLARALLGKRALLVLDNLEHLMPSGAGQVAALVAACPTLRMLVTSRERLVVAAERAWPVPPMSEPDGERLFLESAQAAGVTLAPDDTVRELCRRLDELPLALQLAAARTRSLSPAAILDRLDQQLSLLTSRSRDVDERQRTLEATIAWSYDLLDPDEQRVLRALSVFAGGCSLEAAEHVAGADLDTVESLLDKSLIRHRVDQAGQDRYWMLETIREYAHQQLETTGEADPVCRAHIEWFAAALAPLWRPVRRFDRDATAQLKADLDNGRLALDTALDRGDSDLAGRLLGVLELSWLRSGQNRVALDRADRYLALDRDGLDPAARLVGDGGAAEILRFTGQPARARALYESCIELARRSPNVPSEVFGKAGNVEMPFLTHISELALWEGDVDSARSIALEALAMREAAGQPFGIAHALNGVVSVDQATGQWKDVAAHLRRMIELLGDSPESIGHHIALAEAELANGRPGEASRLLVEHLPTGAASDDAQDVLYGLHIAAQALAVYGRHQLALTVWQAAELAEAQTGLVMPPWDRQRFDAARAASSEARSGDARAIDPDSLSPAEALSLARTALREELARSSVSGG